jgi:ubiquinone/menaquinone biosynthesis C-methylase UbiE
MDNMDKTSDKIRKRYDRSSKFYDLTETMMGNGKMRQWRTMIWKEARGNVLEVGVGTGMNIQYYPNHVNVTAIDFSEKMLRKAKEKAEKLSKNVDLRLMDAQQLEFPDEIFDSIITTCVFCSVPDAVKGLKEIRRVCKKDGQIIMLEHVRSKNLILGIIMDLLNPVVARIVGANINRDTVKNLKSSGLKVDVEKDLMMDIVKYIKCSVIHGDGS